MCVFAMRNCLYIGSNPLGEWTHRFESGGEVSRDLVIGYAVCLGLSSCGVRSPEGDWSRRRSTLGCGREAFWTLVAQLAVRPVMVVLAAVVFNDYAGFCQGAELLPVEVLVAQASMETLDEAIATDCRARYRSSCSDWRPAIAGLPGDNSGPLSLRG